MYARDVCADLNQLMSDNLPANKSLAAFTAFLTFRVNF